MGRPAKKISAFDVALGAVVRSKRTKRSLSQAEVATVTGIALSNYQRREEGRNEITASELERIAAVVQVPAYRMVQEALEDYGGMEKLLAEYAPVSDPLDNVSYLGHVTPPVGVAAEKGGRVPPKD